MKKRAVLALLLAWAFAIVVVNSLIFLGVLREPSMYLTFLGASNSLAHWIGWVGALYLAVASPFYSIFKYKAPKLTRPALNVHMVGSMVAVLLVSVHFSWMVTRPSLYRDFGVGVLLHVFVFMVAATGLLLYSSKAGKNVWLTQKIHVYSSLAFYVALIAHAILIYFLAQ